MHGINLLSHKVNIEGGLISITECRDGKAKNYGKRGKKGETVQRAVRKGRQNGVLPPCFAKALYGFLIYAY